MGCQSAQTTVAKNGTRPATPSPIIRLRESEVIELFMRLLRLLNPKGSRVRPIAINPGKDNTKDRTKDKTDGKTQHSACTLAY